jgi:hypothetical protein
MHTKENLLIADKEMFSKKQAETLYLSSKKNKPFSHVPVQKVRYRFKKRDLRKKISSHDPVPKKSVLDRDSLEVVYRKCEEKEEKIKYRTKKYKEFLFFTRRNEKSTKGKVNLENMSQLLLLFPEDWINKEMIFLLAVSVPDPDCVGFWASRTRIQIRN